MDHMKTMRKPTWGIVPPRGEVSVLVDKPVDIETEAPLLFASASNVVVIKQVMPTGILLENKGPVPVFYMLVIVPRVAIEMMKTKWLKLWRESPLRQIWQNLRAGGDASKDG
jgi:hypothetical protein